MKVYLVYKYDGRYKTVDRVCKNLKKAKDFIYGERRKGGAMFFHLEAMEVEGWHGFTKHPKKIGNLIIH